MKVDRTKNHVVLEAEGAVIFLNKSNRVLITPEVGGTPIITLAGFTFIGNRSTKLLHKVRYWLVTKVLYRSEFEQAKETN